MQNRVEGWEPARPSQSSSKSKRFDASRFIKSQPPPPPTSSARVAWKTKLESFTSIHDDDDDTTFLFFTPLRRPQFVTHLIIGFVENRSPRRILPPLFSPLTPPRSFSPRVETASRRTRMRERERERRAIPLLLFLFSFLFLLSCLSFTGLLTRTPRLFLSFSLSFPIPSLLPPSSHPRDPLSPPRGNPDDIFTFRHSCGAL